MMFDTVEEVASFCGEELLEKVESFDSSVFLGSLYVYKIKCSDIGFPSKERRVLDYVHERASYDLSALLPRVVDELVLSDGRQVTVQTRMPGAKATELSPARAASVARVLGELHALPAPNGITEFEGVTEPSLARYVSQSADRFVDKLSLTVGNADLALAERAKGRLIECITWFTKAKPVIVHKDIFLENLLFEDEELTAIVDWDAAQTAPPEWEHAILRQRFPNVYSEIYDAYSGTLSEEGMDLCALLQALRFWKSFPGDQAFADVQRHTIMRIIGHG